MFAGLGCKLWRRVSLGLTSGLQLDASLLEKQDYAADLGGRYGSAGVTFFVQPVGVLVETSSGMVIHDTTSGGPSLAVSLNCFDYAGMAAAISRFDDIASLGSPAFERWIFIAEVFPSLAMGPAGVQSPEAFATKIAVSSPPACILSALCALLIYKPPIVVFSYTSL